MRLPRLWKLAAATAVVGVVVAGGGYVLIQRSQPPTLSLATGAATTPAPLTTLDTPLARACRQPALPAAAAGQNTGLSGLWVVQPGSVAGYRAHEKFAELPSPHVAVSRTGQISGWLLAMDQGGVRAIETACVAVDLATLKSVDELPGFNTANRDGSARDFLNVDRYPFAIFQPYPLRITADIAGGTTAKLHLAGLLELHGVSRPVTFDVDVRLTSGQAAVAGQTAVAVGDYGMKVPQEAGGFVAVDPNITLEISLVLARA